MGDQFAAKASRNAQSPAAACASPRYCDTCKKKQERAKHSDNISEQPIAEVAPSSEGRPLDPSAQSSSAPGLGHSISRIPVMAPVGTTKGASLQQMQLNPPSGISPLIQAKLAISQPGDALEQEADRIAEKVMAMPLSPPPQERAPLTQLQRSSAQTISSPVPPIVGEVLRSPGAPLDTATRSFMEPRFGYDLGQVRVHADSKAAESARALNARAYTFAGDIVFGAGQHMRGTITGQRLLAHELAHVIQQDAIPRDRIQRQIGSSTDGLWWNGLPDAPNPSPSQEDADICQKIDENRNNIHERFMTSQQGKGYLYTSAQEATLPQRPNWDKSKGTREYIEKHPDYQEGVDAAKGYKAWLSTAEPSGGAAGATDPRKVAQWQLWQDISDEGDPSSMNTYDRPDIANVTWGRGFAAAGGQLQLMMMRLFNIDPQVHDLFYDAGITLEDKSFVVVDPAGHYKTRGLPAQRLIEFDRRLISLFVNLAQGAFVPDGEKHRQAVLDVQFEQFTSKGGTADIPNFALGWTRQARALVGHNIHYGGTMFAKFRNPWLLFAGISGDLKSVIRKIAEVWGEERVLQSGGSCFVAEDPNTLINRLQRRAKGIAMRELEGPFSTEIVQAEQGPLYDPNKPHVFWTLNFWIQPGRVYFRAQQEEKYYRLKE